MRWHLLGGMLLGFLVASLLYAGVIFTQIPGPQTAHAAAAEGSVSIPLLAVGGQRQDGIVGMLTVRQVPGSGNVLISTNPFLQTDLQYSANLAVDVAAQTTRSAVSGSDFIFTYELPADIVGGGSAGAATTIAVMSLLSGDRVREDVAITGTIQPDGTIGPVGGVLEKLHAAAQAGYGLMLVPEGQSQIRFYEPVVEERSAQGFVIYDRHYVPRVVDLAEVGEEWGIEVREVATVAEAAEIMLE